MSYEAVQRLLLSLQPFIFDKKKRNKMNILYLHGLDSKLSPQKREILEEFGKVFAPDMDYHKNPDAIATVLEMFADIDINAVVGSSMGGFVAYHVSNLLHRPALLFNPALAKRSVAQNIPQQEEMYNNYKQLVIGQQDEVVNPSETLQFLPGDFHPITDLRVHLVPKLGHRIPVKLFKEEVGDFFGSLCY